MKSNLKDIEENMSDTLGTLKNNAKIAIKLRSDYGILEHEIAKSFNENLTEYMKEIFKLEGKLKKSIHEDTAGLNHIKRQLVDLIKEKILVQEAVNCTTSRISAMEGILGCESNKLRMNEESMEQKEMIFTAEDYME